MFLKSAGIFIRWHFILAALILSVAPFGKATAFDLLQGLWPNEVATVPASPQQPLTHEELLWMRQNVHDMPLQPLSVLEQELFRLAAAGDVAGLKAVLVKGARVSVRDAGGDSALALAVRGGHLEAARELLLRGAWPSGKAADGFTPLAQAAKQGNAPLARELLRSGARTEERTDSGNTPLTLAVMFGHAGVARELMKRGADAAARAGRSSVHNGQPALVIAAALDHEEILRILLRFGADPNIVDQDFQTPLQWALLKGNRRNVETLLAAGGDPQALPIGLCVFHFEPPLSACR